MCKHGHCCRPVSVCPSVTLVDCIQTAEDIVKLLTRPGSLIIPIFLTLSAGTNYKENPFSRGAKHMGMGKFCDFQPKSLTISEMVRPLQFISKLNIEQYIKIGLHLPPSYLKNKSGLLFMTQCTSIQQKTTIQ